MQMIECMVAVGNDPQNIVHRDPSRPVSYPEMLVLQYIHGDEAVSDAYHVGNEDRDNATEIERLKGIYGAKPILDVFPGVRPRLPMANSQIKPRTTPTRPRRKPVPDRLGEAEPEEQDEFAGPSTEMPEDAAPGAPRPEDSPEDMGLPPVADEAEPRRVMRGKRAAPAGDVDSLRDGE